MSTVFEIYYRPTQKSDYKKFNTQTAITDFIAATQLRKAVERLKGTKDVIVTNHTVRQRANGESTVKQLANIFIK